MNMQPLDIERFWHDDARAHVDNCFAADAPQVALDIRMSEECVYAELGVDGHPWVEAPREVRIALNTRYNDLSERAVGLRLLPEDLPPSDAILPPYRQIGEVFGGRYEIVNHTTWLHSDIKTVEQLERQLDFAERVDLRDFVLPANWYAEKRRIYEAYGVKPRPFTHIRGPVTLATSIYGVENLLFLYYDTPELFTRFSNAIARVVHAYIDLFRDEAGYTEDTLPYGFSFADDDCNLLTPPMYEAFGYPVLKSVFDRVSPNAYDMRYQHSDSAMAHLLPILGRLDLTGVNFGPTVMVDEIRRYLPNARIDGCLAPFTFMRNDVEGIVSEVRRDIDMIRACGTKGLNVTTAGSINNGSLLSSMRLIMQVIQNYGQY